MGKMDIRERMQRNRDEDKIEIGRIVEQIVTGQRGSVLKAIIEGIVATELARKDNLVPADRVLGRLEALSELQEKLDICVDIKRQLTEVVKDAKRVGSGSEEQSEEQS